PFWNNPGGEAAANLWGYIDARDAAQACRLALQADLTGHEPFFIAAPNTFMKTPTADLVRRFYPETKIREERQGKWALLSTAKAERMLGFRAEHLWESYF